MKAAPDSDRGPEFCPHDVALHRKRDRHGAMRRADRFVSGLVDLRHCPSRLSTLCSMLAHQGSIYKQFASQNHCERHAGMHTYTNSTIVRACQECTSFTTGSCIKPLSHLSLSPVALSLMLMSRRKVETRFTMSWACPQSMLH